MKIIDVRSKIVVVPLANWGKLEPINMWYAVRHGSKHAVFWVETDEGVTGISCIRYPSAELNQFLIMNFLKPLIMGRDPFEVESIRAEALFNTNLRTCPGAISAIDMALWDIIGKVSEQPLYKLWGGKIRDPIPVRYWLDVKSPEQMAREAKRAVSERGWKAFKIKLGTDPDVDLERVRLIREAVGNGIELSFDLNGGYRLDSARKVLKKMCDYDPDFFEEPIPGRWPDHAGCLEGMAELRQLLGVPIEAHNHATNNPAFIMALIEKRAADVLHTNCCFYAGAMMGKEICHIAEAGGLLVTGQSNCAELGPKNAFNLHMIASTPAFKGTNDSSTHRLESPGFDIIKNPFETINGTIKVPEGPGLGVELDMDKVELGHENFQKGLYKDEKGIAQTESFLWSSKIF